jgi:RHS repeat-associated protein
MTGQLPSKGLFRIGLFSVLCVFMAASSFAQTSATDGSTPTGLQRGAPTGSYSLSGFEDINLFNGNLNVHLPILGIGGRGGARTTMMLPFNIKKWRVESYDNDGSPIYYPTADWWTGLEVGYGPGVLQGRNGTLQTRQCHHTSPSYYYNVNKYTYSTLSFIMPDGTEVELHDTLNGGAPLTSTNCSTDTGPSRGTTFVSVNGEGMTFISDSTIYDFLQLDDGIVLSPSGYLLMRDGTRYRIDVGKVSWIRDRNGNKIVFAYDSYSRVTTITDSLNRQVTVEYDYSDSSPYGVCDRIHFKGTAGTERIIRVSKTTMGNALRSDFSLQSPHDMFGFTDGSTTNYNPTVVSKLWLPNSDSSGAHYQYYQFFYDSEGELARIELPTGGAIEYDMGNGVGNIGSEIYRVLTERRVYPDGSTLANRTTYSVSANSYGNSRPWTTTVTVDQLDSSSTLLGRSKHYFNGSAGASLGWPSRYYIYPAWNEAQEYETESFASDGTTVLRRVNNTSAQHASVSWWSSWASGHSLYSGSEPANDPRLTETDSTLVDTNQVSKQTFSYDDYNNQTDSYEYDFGSGSAGSLVRHSHTDFLTTNSVNSTDYTTTSIYLRSLPTQTSVYDSGGTERARTTNEYDNYTSTSPHAALTDRSSISGFDSSFSTSYTTRGNATATTHYLLDSGTVTGSVSAYAQFDIAGNVFKAIDPRGNATLIYYDDCFGAPNGEAETNSPPSELSTVSQTSFAFVTKVTNAKSQTAFSQYDYYTGQPVDGEDANGTVASGYYADALDRPTKVVRGSNLSTPDSQTTFAYDDSGKSITTTSDRDSYNDTSHPLKSVILYDGLGRTFETHAYETSSTYITTKQNFDALGRAYQSSNPYRSGDTVYWTTTAFDSLGRVASVTTPDSAAVTTSYSGNTVTVTDQAGKARKSVSDALGRLTTVYEDPSSLNYSTSYTYDVLNNLTQVSQGSQTRSFAYDSLKRITSAANPESGTVTVDAYDDNGNVLVTTDARGVSTHVSYDELNRPTRRWFNNSNSTSSTTNGSLPSGVAATDEVAYFYDSQSLPSGAPSYTRGSSVGRLVAVTYGGGSAGTYRGYDALGRIVRQYQQTDSVNYLVEAAYAPWGMTSETYPSVPGASDRRTVSYSPDGAGRLSSLSSSATSYAPAASVSSISYAAHGALSSETYGNSLIHAATYNTRLQTSEIKLGTSSNSTSVVDLTYSYGTTANNGDVLSASYSGGGLSYTQSFGYDALNRLSTATETNGGTTNWSQTNAYDRYGNRQIDYGGGSYNLTFSSSTNRITTGGFSYDSAGNLTNDTIHTYAFDANDKIKSVDSTSAYVYDGESARVRKLVGENTRFVYGIGGQLVAEFDGSSGNLKKEYISGGITIEPTAVNSNGTQYPTGDHLGSPRVITNSSGSVVSRHDYMPFGEELGAGTGGRTTGMGFGSGSGDNNRKKFTGYERDNETGLDFAQARYDSSSLGRFTSPDPLMASANPHRPQTWNRYSYVLNNPLRLVDPSGMMVESHHKGGETFYGTSFREDFVTGGSDYYESYTASDRLSQEAITNILLDGGDPPPAGADDPATPQNPAALAPNGLASDRPLSDAQCDGRLAEIFGGPGAVVGSTRDPLTVGSNPAALAYAQKYGLPTDRIGERAPGHGPAPYNNPDPKSPDQGGIIHIYGNAQGTASNTPLYAPSGGTVGPIFTTASGNVTRRVSYSTGLGISFVHVIPGGGPNRSGSVTLGTIGGPDSGGANYRHTHIVFFNGGTRVDPRRVFCGQ